MRKILSITFAAIAAIVLLSSCNKDPFGTYRTVPIYTVSPTVEDGDRDAILQYVKSFPYFQSQQEYTSTYSEACCNAQNDFFAAVRLIDEKEICCHLKPYEIFTIVLTIAEKESTSGQILCSVRYTPDLGSGDQ